MNPRETSWMSLLTLLRVERRTRPSHAKLRALAVISAILGASGFGPLTTDACRAEETVFSGPQPGEALPPLSVAGVYDDRAGTTFDPAQQAGDKPTLFVFVHKLSRPGVAVTRAITNYARSIEGPSVHSAIIWLDADRAGAEQYLNRARRSLNLQAPVGVSIDGLEGPGAYGLNRNVELTVLVASRGKVTANFALVQPSLTDAPDIAAALAKLAGKPQPTIEALEALAYPGRAKMARKAKGRDRMSLYGGRELRPLMRQLIAAKEPQEIRGAVKAIETWVGETRQRRQQLTRMAGAVLKRDLGSEDVQRRLREWQEPSGEQETAESESDP